MIYIFLGTKGQLIKMAPVMREFQRRKIDYVYIHTGQHTQITHEIADIFGLKKPDIYLSSKSQDVVNFRTGIKEAIFSTLKSFKIKKTELYDKRENNICLVHGDAFPVVSGIFFAKMLNMKIGHIEAGERTGSLKDPFPEELFRRIADNFSDYLFVDDSSKNNLSSYKAKKIFNIRYNTVFDAVRYIANNDVKVSDNPFEIKNYVLVTIHRLETITSIKKMKFVIEILNEISIENNILFILHPATKEWLIKFNLLKEIKNNKIKILPLQNYIKFINLMKNSKFIITDGGGPQQESLFLEIPCLLLRDKTERENCSNVFISNFQKDRVSYFLNNISKFKIKIKLEDYSPSKKIVSVLKKFM